MGDEHRRTHMLLSEVDRIAYFLSIGLSLVLLILAVFLQQWQLPDTGLLSATKETASTLITELVPIFLVFAFSYHFLRRIQTIKSEQESDELSEKVASRTATQIETRLRQIDQKLDLLEEVTSESIRLEDRREWDMPLEARLEHAQYVDISGLNLVGIAAIWAGYLHKKACAGCKIRLLLADPESQTAMTVAGTSDGAGRMQDLQRSITKLEPLLETANVELRYSSVTPPFSLLIIDPQELHGEVQVELFIYRVSASERPHFVLTQASNKRWYDFFRDQFERLWNDARPHERQNST